MAEEDLCDFQGEKKKEEMNLDMREMPERDM